MVLQLTTGWLYLKSDVYGFGVVMLEIVTGLRAVGSGKYYQLQSLVDWARPYLTSIKKTTKNHESTVETSLSIESCIESSSTHHRLSSS